MLVTYRWIIEGWSTTRFMQSAWKGTITHSAMKKLPRKGGHRSGKQDRRNPRFSGKLVMLYEDDAVVALNKPAGLPAVPVKGSDTPSACSLLSAELKRRRQRAFLVHRIDRFIDLEEAECCGERCTKGNCDRQADEGHHAGLVVRKLV